MVRVFCVKMNAPRFNTQPWSESDTVTPLTKVYKHCGISVALTIYLSDLGLNQTQVYLRFPVSMTQNHLGRPPEKAFVTFLESLA